MDKGFQEDRPVLVVAADKETRHSLAGMIKSCGLEAVIAADGNKALEILTRNRFSTFILDLVIPGNDWLELCRRARELATVYLPIICVTESMDDDTLRAIFDAGVQDYIVKPLRSAEVEFRVKSAQRLGRAMVQAARQQELAGTVCHELNQPLQYIMGMVQLVLMDVEQPQPVWGQLKSIQEKIEQMGDITGRLMTIIKDYGNGSLIDRDRKVAEDR